MDMLSESAIKKDSLVSFEEYFFSLVFRGVDVGEMGEDFDGFLGMMDR
jgi:hypothetical protein